MMTQILGSQTSVSENQTEFLAPRFGLTQSWLLGAFAEYGSKYKIYCIYLPVCLTLSFGIAYKMKFTKSSTKEEQVIENLIIQL